MSPQDLIAAVDQQRIWGFLVGHERIGDKFLRPSWIGPDRHPGCSLRLKGDKVRYYDPKHQLNLDIIDCYKLVYPQDTYAEMVDKILSWNGSSSSTASLVNSGELRESRFTLTPTICDWTPWGVDFWEKRGIDVERLSHKNTLTQEICGHDLSGKNDQGSFYSSQSGQGFCFWHHGKPKLYYPFADKERKFKGKVLPNEVWLVDRSAYRKHKGLPDTETLLISKGPKDMLVWSTFVACDLMDLSAEGVHPSPEWLFNNVRMKYKRCLIVLDPDEAGILGGNKLLTVLTNLSNVGTFVCKSWPWPDPISKDLDRFRVDNGYESTIKFLKANNFHKIFD